MTPSSQTSRSPEATRQRLIDAAIRRFQQDGYDATTAAAIAADAGVTERTFFRYFPTKGDVLVANWEQHRDEMRATLAASDGAALLDVVREGILLFVARVRDEIGDALDSVVRVYADRAAFAALLMTMLEIEEAIAVEIGRRSGVSDNDLRVRIAANTSMGVFRAALRAVVVDGSLDELPALVDEGLDRVAPLYDDLGPRR